MSLYAAHLPLDLHGELREQYAIMPLLDVRGPAEVRQVSRGQDRLCGTSVKATGLDDVAGTEEDG